MASSGYSKQGGASSRSGGGDSISDNLMDYVQERYGNSSSLYDRVFARNYTQGVGISSERMERDLSRALRVENFTTRAANRRPRIRRG